MQSTESIEAIARIVGTQGRTAAHDVVFLLDVDNTLLDADRINADLDQHLQQRVGEAAARRYWALYKDLRLEFGVVDYLGALQSLGREMDGSLTHERRVRQGLMQVSGFLMDYPFAERLYPQALDVLRYLGRHGTTALLTDGDVVMQPRKLERAGLWQAVEGRVLVYTHKERMLEAVARQYPARHYVMVDDKLRILAAMKAVWQDRLTTVWPRQGHYALDPAQWAGLAAPDVSIACIGALTGATRLARWFSKPAHRPPANAAMP